MSTILVVPACDFGSCNPTPAPPFCDGTAGYGGDLDGFWQIHAEGKRTGCSSRTLNGDFELTNEKDVHVEACLIPGQPLPGVVQLKPADELEARILHQEFRLSSADGVGNPVFDGSCVSFTLSGDTPQGPVFYRFLGAFGGRGLAGTFEGVGPESSCLTQGEFTVRVTGDSDVRICAGERVDPPRGSVLP